MFIVFPAIDLRSGRVVRLKEGDPARQTTYGHDPASIAEKWLRLGANWLHLVNLDGAFEEDDTANQTATSVVLETAREFGAQVQFGGGIRSAEQIERILNLGVSRVVLGTVAIEHPPVVTEAITRFGPDKIAVGIDARGGRVRIRGWQSDSGIAATDLALQMRGAGVRTVIFTDISRDGLGSGLNLESTRVLAGASGLDVIASGGVHTLEDVIAARQAGLAGAIIGRALYEGTVDLKAALESAAA